MHKSYRGYTLYELLLTVTLVAILMGLAIPSFGNIVANGRIRTEIDALFHAVHIARKESIMRRSVVSICPSNDGVDCSAELDWSQGWILFNNADRDEPPRVDTDEAVLQVHKSSSDVRIRANRRGFTLRATHKRATNGTIIVGDRNNRGTPRALVVIYTGRPRVTVEDRRGDAYSCPD